MDAPNYKEIPISDIIVDEDRARPLDMGWVAVLAESIAEQGLLNVPTVYPVGDKYKLITGSHRFAAVKVNAEDEDDAQGDVATVRCHIRNYTAKDGDHIRLEEVTENVVRNELNALDRARSLFELDTLYKKLYPELKVGGNSQVTGDKNRTELNAVRSELYEKIGLGERSFQIAVAIWKGLSVSSRARLYGTWIASHRASLITLSGQTPANQKKLLDILFPKSGEPKATNMPDALYVLEHGRLLDHRESKFDKVIKVTKALKPDELELVFEAHVVQIMSWLKTRDQE